MPAFDAVIFDYGNTLIEFAYPTDELLRFLDAYRQRIGDELRRPAPSARELMDGVLLPLEQIGGSLGEDEIDFVDEYAKAWRRAGLELTDDLLLEMLDAEQRVWERSITLVDCAISTLAALKGHGIRLGLCSNASFPAGMMRRQVDGNGIGRYMDSVVFSSAIGKRKPSPVIYEAVLTGLGVDANRTLFVGDRVREDYEGPMRFGMSAVICTAHAGQPVPPEVRTIESLSEIQGLL